MPSVYEMATASLPGRQRGWQHAAAQSVNLPCPTRSGD